MNELITKKTFRDIIRKKQNLFILLGVWLISILSCFINYTQFTTHATSVEAHRVEVREKWENRPDKHPHRMAHYGYLVFRLAHPMSILDKGLDDYLGNIIFLEAHKQNTANISEANSSGVLVRFGVFTPAFILQVLLPLIIFFVGFNLITKEKEDNTLKLLSIQGASKKAIILGKVKGLWHYALLLSIPIFPILIGLISYSYLSTFSDILFRSLLILFSYALFYFLLSSIVVGISTLSKNSSIALINLITIWLLMSIILPKAVQYTAQISYPIESRIAFESKLEKEILKVGDSHNPNDPYFSHIKDSLLNHYNVDNVNKLPFNYGGFIMKQGEKISTGIYNAKMKELEDTFEKQYQITQYSSYFNPMTAIKSFSTTVCATDYYAYKMFQNQAEEYRYKLAQYMNDLQIEHISNDKSKNEIISQENWKNLPDFKYQYTGLLTSLQTQLTTCFAPVFWFAISLLIILLSIKKLKFN
ncbi:MULTISPECIES: DUF3526 domain-containing protein [Myroides]|uniref:DUF3526 domain-containing protein n=1 Tax=Myroides TaxID=76831 RepID=UPI0013260080|nr:MULTISPECIES: DUF3526 domain-containing protein [Myroides]MDM1405728.1 DUF3526 domain-containing protein [Myroides marinus]MDM1444448.1 DUF3526 domain-containing protein [Myroides odoratimimus]MVX36588.1 DUF3526 domain-containing protein [Myroides sp. LoEW2-1]